MHFRLPQCRPEADTLLHAEVFDCKSWDGPQSCDYASRMFRQGLHLPQDYGFMHRRLLPTQRQPGE